MQPLALGNLTPNLVLLLVICWSLLRGERAGALWGFIGGVFLDLFSGMPLGVSSLTLMALGFIVGIGETNLFRSNFIFSLSAGFLSSIGYDLVSWIIRSMADSTIHWNFRSLQIIALAAVVHTALLLIIYPPMAWLHRKTHSYPIL